MSDMIKLDRFDPAQHFRIPVLPGTQVVQGEMLELIQGHVRPLVAGGLFFGYAMDSAVSTAFEKHPGSAARSDNASVLQCGVARTSAIYHATRESIGAMVYGYDSRNLTLKPTGSVVGFIVGVVCLSPLTWLVRFDVGTAMAFFHLQKNLPSSPGRKAGSEL